MLSEQMRRLETRGQHVCHWAVQLNRSGNAGRQNPEAPLVTYLGLSLLFLFVQRVQEDSRAPEREEAPGPAGISGATVASVKRPRPLCESKGWRNRVRLVDPAKRQS